MIQIVFKEPNTQKWKRWRTACEKKTRELLESVERGKSPQITDLYKRKSIKKEVYFSKDGPFHGKCAYCECYITDFQRGDIEHYRPKLAVTDENDQPIQVRDEQGQVIPHRGYYWLAYDWRNLLPSCTSCNQPGESKLGKRNRFPVANTHARKPDEIDDEQSLLIHPVEDNPEEHLSVDIKTGELIPCSPKGEMTVRILGLNIRDRLPEERRKMINHVRALVVRIVSDPDESKMQGIFKELEAILSGKCAFSLAGRAMLNELQPLACFLVGHNSQRI